jgi:hypothetical protein
MRNIVMVSAVVVLFAGLSFAQGPGRVEGGFYYPGVFAGPFIPLVSTPSASWSNFVPRAGATNATEGNFAGASASGFSSAHPHFGFNHEMRGEGMRGEEMRREDGRGHERDARREGAGFNSGMATSDFQESVIVAMGQPHATAPSGTPRQITNQDVEQVNQKNGYVKYGDHVEHLDPAVVQ